MEAFALQKSQFTKQGFTHLFKVSYTDVASQTTDDTDETVTLLTLVEGDVVFPEVVVDVKTDFAGITACNASIGVTSAVTQLSANTSVLAAAANAFASSDVAPYVVPSGGKDLLVNFDPDANTEALSDLTAGELWIWARISKKADRVNIEV